MSVKKWISLVLSVLVLAIPVTFGSNFNDLDSVKWAQSSIENMAFNGYIGGYSDGTFKPSSNFSRAELVVIINKMNGFTEESNIEFKDVPQNHWAYKEISKAVQAGFVSGYSDGSFRPNEPVSREQVATILNNLYHLENTTLSNPINDLSTISPWAVQAVVNCMANGIMGGYPDGSFGGKNKITRAEGVVVLNKIVVQEIPTIEKWIVSQDTKSTLMPVPPVPPATGGTPGTGASDTPPGGDETLHKLETVVSRMHSHVIPVLTTDLQRETAEIILDSITNYLTDQSYATASDVALARNNVQMMSNIDYQAFRNAITRNILLSDLVALNDVFQLIEY